MAATGLLLPKQQFFDDNGDPLVGGKVYSYLGGTSTPSSTYSNSTLATPNANPTILDAAGRGTFYVDPAISLKIVLKDTNDVTLWTQDLMTPAEEAF